MLLVYKTVMSYLPNMHFFEEITSAVSPVDTIEIVLFLV